MSSTGKVTATFWRPEGSGSSAAGHLLGVYGLWGQISAPGTASLGAPAAPVLPGEVTDTGADSCSLESGLRVRCAYPRDSFCILAGKRVKLHFLWQFFPCEIRFPVVLRCEL